MATGINPIQLALRDVGTGFGALLSDEARRRQDALAMQQQQGQLSLQQATLKNQAEVAAAQGQVNLAKVGAEGRQFDVTTGLKERELTQQGEFQRGQLDINREHNRLLGLQETRLGPLTTAQVGEANQRGEELRLKNIADRQPVFVDDIKKTMRGQLAAQGMPADQIEQKLAQGQHILDNISSAANLPVDPVSGKPYMTQGQANARVQFALNVNKLAQRDSLTADQLVKHVSDFVKETKDDPGMLHLSYEEKTAMAYALVLHPQQYFAQTSQKLSPELETYRKEKIAELEKRVNTPWYGGTPTPATKEQIDKLEKDIITPYAYRRRAQIARDVLAAGGGKPVVPTAGGATTQTRAGLEGMAGTIAQTYGLSPAQLQGHVDIENPKWNPAAVNEEIGAEGGVGLGQHIKSAFAQYGREGGDRTNASDSLEAMAKQLADLKDKYGGDMSRAYAAYYAGEGKIPKTGPIPETVIQQSSKGPITQHPRAYAQKVMAAVAKREAAQGTVAAAAVPTGASAPPAVVAGTPLPAPSLATGARPGGDFNAPPPPASLPPLQRARSPLDPLVTPMGALPGWVDRARNLPAAIGQQLLPTTRTTPLSLAAAAQPTPPVGGSVPPPTEVAPASSTAGPLLTGTPAAQMAPQDRRTFEQALGRQYPEGVPDGVHRILMGSTWFDIVIYNGTLQAVAPAGGR